MCVCPSVEKDDICGTKLPCQILRNFLTMMEILPTWMYLIFGALNFVDTLWQKFAVNYTNINCCYIFKTRVDKELKIVNFTLWTVEPTNDIYSGSVSVLSLY